jgi:tRNA nucleotidyltransferase (CCA-adding enzyme)
MQTYLVGGAVRDGLLGLLVAERDWVVVGATPSELEALGYRRVGTSFPVYLHPVSNEEYALARTEIKTSPGYRGFDVRVGPDVTLEEDLQRRDLTINAMAQDSEGRIIDPYGGRGDLEARVLRHVSDAFREDPVRILRVARFAARFHTLGFRVAPDTESLMSEMVAAGEANALVPERVWQETETALAEPRPDVFLAVLRQCGALAAVFPEVDALFGVPQPAKWHPEIDTGVHLLMAMEQAARLGAKPEARFAVLVHDLGKGTTPKAQWPGHSGHEERSVELTLALCRRLGVPSRYRDLGVAVARFHGLCHLALELRPGTVLSLLEGVDAFRRRERFEDFLMACEADARGRLGRDAEPYPQAARLRTALAAASRVDAAGLAAQGIAGEALREALRQARTQAIARAFQSA